ncbi:MAG: hypothetical protein ABSC05_02630 [Candidatus Solibacter sp.]|jgi:hypothetical protein
MRIEFEPGIAVIESEDGRILIDTSQIAALDQVMISKSDGEDFPMARLTLKSGTVFRIAGKSVSDIEIVLVGGAS